MAYLGNKKGPRESEILNKLGPEYFGCSPSALEDDISHHIFAESRQEVVPVHVDEVGHPYIVFSSAKTGQPLNFVLEENGYHLSGDIKTFSEDEQKRWKNRVL